MCFAAEHGPGLSYQLLEICFRSTQSLGMKSWLLQSERLLQDWISHSLQYFFNIFLHTVATCTVIFTPSVEITWWQWFQHLFLLLIADARAAITTKQPIRLISLVDLGAVEGENSSVAETLCFAVLDPEYSHCCLDNGVKYHYCWKPAFLPLSLLYCCII